jgi:hypothetical protein
MRRVLLGAIVLLNLAPSSGCDSGVAAPGSDSRVDVARGPDGGRKDLALAESVGRELGQPSDGTPVLPDVGREGGQMVDQSVPLPDGFAFPDGGGVPVKEFVVDSLLLPMTQAQTQQFSADLNGDGTPDNGLAKILGSIGGFGFAFNPQDSLTGAINTGDLLFLVRVQAQDFVNAPVAVGKTWQGNKQVCCIAKDDPPQCASQAKQTCFTGSHLFAPDPAAPNPSTATGSIASGKMAFGPAPLKLAISLSGSPVVVSLKKGSISGQLKTSPDGITDGVIVGGVPQQDVDTIIIPALAAQLDQLLKDPTGDFFAKLLVGAMFDTSPKDGTITGPELASNGTVKGLFAGDVDVDGDGVKELSVGVGFTAVGAVINAP